MLYGLDYMFWEERDLERIVNVAEAAEDHSMVVRLCTLYALHFNGQLCDLEAQLARSRSVDQVEQF
jgi:hypothetical protein